MPTPERHTNALAVPLGGPGIFGRFRGLNSRIPLLGLVEVGEQIQTFKPSVEMLKCRQAVFLEACKIIRRFQYLNRRGLEFVESVFGAVLAQASTFQIDNLLK